MAESTEFTSSTLEYVLPLADPKATPEAAGAKAASLARLAATGLPVPPGFILTVSFFRAWLAHIQASPEWARVLSSRPEDLAGNCRAVKALCLGLELDERQRAALSGALDSLDAGGQPRLLAVRSSSPEEDLEGLSYAGGYETILGARRACLEDAVRRCFASAFDARVLLYKQEHGLAVDRPRMAVIVQRQIAASAAGVAFSLNPLNNCYDEAVINANFGLGEPVVAGQISPDQFVVDKVTRAILERKIGKKETSAWLAPEGGIQQEPSPSRGRLCLSDDQVLELAEVITRVEDHFGRPMDVEWAYADGALHLLQARPITAYVPLPEALRTPPGVPKQLYLDMTLTKWGMAEPLSAMGTDYIAVGNVAILRMTMGDISPRAAGLLRPILEGRAYINVSINLKMQGQKRVADEYRTMDTLAGDIVQNLDGAEYVPHELAAELRGYLPKVVRQNLGLIRHLLRALRQPEAAQRQYLESVRRLPADLSTIAQETPSIAGLADGMAARLVADTGLFLAVIFAAEIAKRRIRNLFRHEPAEVRERAADLERALPHNVTIEMGMAMNRLSRFDEVGACASAEEFVGRLGAREFSPEFLLAWDGFMALYGFRCPMEMDPATPRPYERPAQFFERLRVMAASADSTRNPQADFQQVRARRDLAYTQLLQEARRKGRRRARQLERNYRILVELGGLREMPKYCAILLTDAFRQRVLRAARALVEAGRLDDERQVFDLTMADLDLALADPALDLRALAERNTRFLRQLDRVREFPRLIDSRGRILRLPRTQAAESELAGEPISPGIVRGPVKVLRTPGEKPLWPGEILVTQATDPGWTPLFFNAGGVILEVGGLLQHGALVAREYGKPCVAGIENVTELLHDGQAIELDGSNGVVRLISIEELS
jgi:phosphohistidine swiveling domain-containing protein